MSGYGKLVGYLAHINNAYHQMEIELTVSINSTILALTKCLRNRIEIHSRGLSRTVAQSDL